MKKTAFTLIELLVVVSVLGVLTALLLPNLIGVRVRARDAAKKSNLLQLKTALRMYYNDYQAYPANDGQGFILGCGVDGDSVCPNDDGSFGVGDTVYMKDMAAIEDYSYAQVDSGDNFLLAIALENQSDPEISVTVTKCGVASPESGVYYLCAD